MKRIPAQSVSFTRKLFPAMLCVLPILAQAQITFTPVLTNVWKLQPGVYDGLPANNANNVRGLGIDAVTTNVLYFSSIGGTNNGAKHVGTLSFDAGVLLYNLDGTGVGGVGTVATEGVRSADDGTIYGSNLSGSPGSRFQIYKWSSGSDTTVVPTLVADVTGPSFQWRIGDYMDCRGSGTNTELVFVGNGSGANITTNFVIFRPTDETCTAFTNFTITIPGGVNNLCGAGVAFEGTNSAIWIRQAGSQNTRHIVYDVGTLTAICDRTNTVDQSACQGLKYYTANGVKLLATVQGSTTAGASQIARVFQIPTAATGPFTSVLSSNIPAQPASQNGNGLGLVDARSGYFVFGAPGHGVSFFGLYFNTSSPPAVTISGSGSVVVQGFTSTFTVSASGSTPLAYQWYYTNSGSVSAISGAITNIYNIATVQTTNAGGYFAIVTNQYGRATSSVVSISVLPRGTSPLFTNIWSLAPGSRPYLTTSDAQRGLAYDPVLNRLALVTRAPTNGVLLLDADTGDDVDNIDISPILAITPPGIFPINMCGVADDGAVYVANLLTSTTSDNFAIYRWPQANSSAGINQAYIGNPGIARIGDTMAVRGAGPATEILCSFRTGTNVALFTTGDGENYSMNVLTVTNMPASAQANGFAGLGLAFGPGDTFWAKSSGFDLRQVSFDLASGMAAVIKDYPNVPTTEGVIGVDNANGYVAMIGQSEAPQNVPIYDLLASGGPSLAALVDREFLPVNNANANGTGSIAVDAAHGRMFVLDSNNGIIALSYSGRPFIETITGEPVISWAATNAVLQAATNAAGPFVDVSGATSPFTNATASEMFFRLRK